MGALRRPETASGEPQGGAVTISRCHRVLPTLRRPPSIDLEAAAGPPRQPHALENHKNQWLFQMILVFLHSSSQTPLTVAWHDLTVARDDPEQRHDGLGRPSGSQRRPQTRPKTRQESLKQAPSWR